MKHFLLVLFLASISTTFSQNITLDQSFGDNGYAAFPIQSVNALTNTVLLPNGQFITGRADVTSVGWSIILRKVDANGVVDTTFSGGLDLDGAIEFKKLLYHNNKLLFVGSYAASYPYDNRELMLVRFNLDGTVDTTFGTNGQTFASYGTAHDDPIDAVIDTAGNSYIYAKHSSDHYLVKVNANGSVDNTYGTGGIVYLHYYNIYNASEIILDKMFFQNDGKLVFIGAKKNSTTNIKASYLVRRLPDGSMDASFGNNGEVIMSNTNYATIKDIQFQYNDNSILILHQYDNSNTTRDRIFLSKIQITDGALVTSFANNGMTAQYQYTSAPILNLKHINVLSDSKILVTGNVSNFWVQPSINKQLFVMRFQANGSVDNSSGGSYLVFNTTPPNSSMRADHMSRLFDLDNGSFILAYSGDSATHGANSYLAKFNGATLGLEDLHDGENNLITISPNPSKKYFIVQHTVHTTTGFTYEIMDVMGRVFQIGNSKFNEEIQTANIPSGLYLLRLETKLGEKSVKKIIIN